MATGETKRCKILRHAEGMKQPSALLLPLPPPPLLILTWEGKYLLSHLNKVEAGEKSHAVLGGLCLVLRGDHGVSGGIQRNGWEGVWMVDSGSARGKNKSEKGRCKLMQ